MNTSGRPENLPLYRNASLIWRDRFFWGMTETAWDLAGGSNRDGTRVGYPAVSMSQDSRFSLFRSSLTGGGSTGLGGFGN